MPCILQFLLPFMVASHVRDCNGQERYRTMSNASARPATPQAEIKKVVVGSVRTAIPTVASRLYCLR